MIGLKNTLLNSQLLLFLATQNMQVWLTQFHAGNFAQKNGEKVKETYHFVNHNVRFCSACSNELYLDKEMLEKEIALEPTRWLHQRVEQKCAASILTYLSIEWHGMVVW